MTKSKLYEYETNELKPMNDKDFFDMLKENKEILDSCVYHSFEKFNNKLYICKRCGGIIDEHDYKWYLKGKEHGRRYD